MASRLGILIVTFRSRRHLPGCLAALGTAHPILVVDNASDDGTVAWIKEHAPGVQLLALPENLGFAAAINLGMQKLADCEYVLWLNPDARIASADIQRLVDALDQDSTIAAIGPLIRRPEGLEPSLLRRPQAWRTALFLLSGMRWHGIGGMTGLPVPGFPWRHLTCGDHLRGSCMLVRMRAWRAIGPLNECFFLYFEETEWCLRARAQGWRICLEPKAQAFHEGKASVRTCETDAPLEYYRSAVLFWECIHPHAAFLLRVLLWLNAHIKRMVLHGLGKDSKKQHWLEDLARIARDPYSVPLRYPRARRPKTWP